MVPEIKMVDGVVHVKLSGKLYVDAATVLRETLLQHLEAGKSKFLIDFADVSYIDSSGLGVLIAIQKRAVQSGGNLQLKNVNGNVKELFELTRLTKVFNI